ncbi:polyprenol monophosphomannose synthase [Thermoflexus sp.]|uniref:polyprenol monophosphomannose synthase n=1 Tax=Thermoflexus sp. TaxID=1969742 RepID=UPI00175ABE0D|nr:polyprenol monophosphomannose synthase [Thermoflexus sp.]
MTRTMVVVPTYNEADNLPRLVEALLGLNLPDLQIMVVDDRSPDGTGEVAEALARAHPGRLMVVHREGPRGLGPAYLEGFRRALQIGAEAIVQMDADLSHPPSAIPRMLERMADYHVVVGSRYAPGGRVDPRWGPGRYWLSRWGNFYARAILGLQVRDATAGFKCWRWDALARMPLDRVRSTGYIFQVEMAYIAQRLGYRVCEIPIFFEDRRVGRSKMNWRIKIEAALRVWELRWRYRDLKPISLG